MLPSTERYYSTEKRAQYTYTSQRSVAAPENTREPTSRTWRASIRIPSPPMKREGGAVRGYYNVAISYIMWTSQNMRFGSGYESGSLASTEINRWCASFAAKMYSLLCYRSVQNVICKKARGNNGVVEAKRQQYCDVEMWQCWRSLFIYKVCIIHVPKPTL